jgi:hypothetical protein
VADEVLGNEALGGRMRRKIFITFVGEKSSHKNVKRLREIVTATKMI